MHHVIVLDKHGNVTENLYHGPDPGRASLTYSRAVLRRPRAHLRWVDGDVLPGLPDNVQAERFGAPCDEPCCVPLAAAWPEEPTVTNL